jgi:hypothetical protein
MSEKPANSLGTHFAVVGAILLVFGFVVFGAAWTSDEQCCSNAVVAAPAAQHNAAPRHG